MSTIDNQYIQLVDLLLEFRGENSPKWAISPYGSGFHLVIGGKTSIFLQQREGTNGTIKGYTLTIYDERGERKGPVSANQVDHSPMYEKLNLLFEKAKVEAASRLDDISSVLNQLRSIAM
jgi:hypothetical protein